MKSIKPANNTIIDESVDCLIMGHGIDGNTPVSIWIPEPDTSGETPWGTYQLPMVPGLPDASNRFPEPGLKQTEKALPPGGQFTDFTNASAFIRSAFFCPYLLSFPASSRRCIPYI